MRGFGRPLKGKNRPEILLLFGVMGRWSGLSLKKSLSKNGTEFAISARRGP